MRTAARTAGDILARGSHLGKRAREASTQSRSPSRSPSPTEQKEGTEGLQRYYAKFEYHGCGFSGVQKQPGERTVQGLIDQSLSKLVQHPVESYISSRTDKGVHALGNTLHFDLVRKHKKTGVVQTPHTAEVVHKAANFHLAKSMAQVSIKEVRQVTTEFHSRYSAKSRTYLFRIHHGLEVSF